MKCTWYCSYIKLVHMEMNACTHVHRQREREKSCACAHAQTYTNAMHTCIDVYTCVRSHPSFSIPGITLCEMPPLELEARSDISDESDGGLLGRYCLGMGRMDDRRKFRSQTSDNMQRWKSRGGKSQGGEVKKWEDKRWRKSEERRCRCAKR